MIPHGIPDVPFADPSVYKDQFGPRGKTGSLALRLLPPNQGGEHEIAALPRVLERHAMRKRAYLACREMAWPNVASMYLRAFERVREDRSRKPRALFTAATSRERATEQPAPKLDHLRTLAGPAGLFQHAVHTVPNDSEGYTTDDNARALVLSVMLGRRGTEWLFAERYPAFLHHAFRRDTGRLQSWMSFDQRWLDETGSEDCHGRAVWALGSVLVESGREELRGAAGLLLEAALPAWLERRGRADSGGYA